MAIILILIFGVNLKILPTSGAYSIGKVNDIGDRIIHLILPVIVLVISHLWYYAYMVRNKLLEEMREEYVVLAKAIMAVSTSHILAGTYIVESIFSYPGLGTLAFESAKYHDYNMLMIISIITGAIVVFSNFIVKIINSKIDPRVEENGGNSFEFPK